MIKKPLAIILAFFIVFSPVYSYAVLPALAAAVGSAGGRVLVGNVIHNLKKSALSKAGMAWMAAGAVGSAGIKSAIESDDWTIEYGAGGGGAGGSWDAPDGGGVDSEGDIDVQIYKLNNSEEICFKFEKTSHGDPNQSYPTNDAACKSLVGLPFDSSTFIKSSYYNANVHACSSVIAYNDSGSIAYSNLNLKPPKQTLCPTKDNKIYMTESEFNAYLTNNTINNNAGDVIKNIYNYDYSQHPNITINNNTYGGNDINNDLSVSADPELNVTPRLKLDIESNRVNLDNVNDENCTKNEQGQYDVCEGSEGEPEEETDPDDPNNPSPEEPPPIECSANGFYKKICDWMDWTKKEHTEPTDTNVDVTDKTSEIVIDDSRISFDDQCPTPKDINITVAGHSFSESLDYQPLCDFFIKLNPFVVGMGGISSALIIAGGIRRG